MTVWGENFIQVNQYTRPALKLKDVKKLIVHYTATPNASALNERNYFNGTCITDKRYASAHIFVDKKEAINIIPLNEIAYAANDNQKFINGQPYRGVKELLPNANFLSISVEMCVEKDGTLHPDTISRTEDVFAELCKRYKLDPINDIVRHFDVTAKNCPAPWVKDNQAFVNFKNDVADKMGKISTTVKTASITTKKSPSNDLIYTRLLKVGVSGQDVKSLQSALNKLEFNCGTPDGKFGNNTEKAVEAFQKKYKLKVDGLVGQGTISKINSLL